MANDGRCACGSRIFFALPTQITTSAGTVFSIPSANVVTCVSCGSTALMLGGDGERKTVTPIKTGLEVERVLFKLALEDWKIDHEKAPNRDCITVEDADRTDFKRLNVPEPDRQRRNEPSMR